MAAAAAAASAAGASPSQVARQSRRVMLAPARGIGDGSPATAQRRVPEAASSPAAAQRRVTLSSRVVREAAMTEGKVASPAASRREGSDSAGVASGGISLTRRKPGATAPRRAAQAPLSRHVASARAAHGASGATSSTGGAGAARPATRQSSRVAPVAPEQRTSEAKQVLHKRARSASDDTVLPRHRERPVALEAKDAPRPRADELPLRKRRRHRIAEPAPVATRALDVAEVAPARSSPGTGAELSEAEKERLRESVHSHLCKMHSGISEDDALVVTEFVSVMVDDRKSPADMLEELTFFKEGAKEFVDFVHKQMGKIIARRHKSTSSPALTSWRHPDRERAVQPARRPVAMDAAIDLTASAAPLGDLGQQIRSQIRPASRSPAVSLLVEDDSPEKNDNVNQRKKDLLAQRTIMLRNILEKLSQAEGEEERSKLRILADKIQAQMKSVKLGGRT